jgi:hypothetical protein
MHKKIQKQPIKKSTENKIKYRIKENTSASTTISFFFRYGLQFYAV